MEQVLKLWLVLFVRMWRQPRVWMDLVVLRPCQWWWHGLVAQLVGKRKKVVVAKHLVVDPTREW